MCSETISQAPTDPSPLDPNKHNTLYKIGFAISVLVLIISFLMSNQDAITRPFVESQLQTIAENIATQAKLNGDEAVFTYGEVSIEGGLFHHQITVVNPKLDYTAHLPFGNVQRTVISTPRALVSSDQISTQNITVGFPDPIDVLRDGFLPILVTFSSTPEYAFDRNGDREVHAIHLPPSFTMTTQAQGADPVVITASYAPHPVLKRVIERGQSQSKSELRFQEVRITTTEEASRMQLDSLEGSSVEGPYGQDARRFESKLAVQQFTIHKPEADKGPFDFTFDVTGTYLTPQNTQNFYAEVRDMEVTVNKIQLTNKHYELNLAGAFSVKPQDAMPSGILNVGIKGFDAFRNSEFVPVKDVTLKNAVITAILDNEDTTLKDAFFTVKRDYNGTLFIGETSFENLVGLVITHSMASKMKEKSEDAAPVGPALKQAPGPEVSGHAAPKPVVPAKKTQ